MGSKICMNVACGTTTTHEWKKGWALRSGGFADLCFTCGSAYESSHFCDTYHSEQSGWRECFLCSKRLHCGCIASRFLVELLDYGGVGCTTCSSCYQLSLATKRNQDSGGLTALTMSALADMQTLEKGFFGNNVDGGRLSRLCQIMEANEADLFCQSHKSDIKPSVEEDRQKELTPKLGEVATSFSKAAQQALGFAKFLRSETTRSMLDVTDVHESLAQQSLSMTLGTPLVTPSAAPPFAGGLTEGKGQSKTFPSHKIERSFPILPKSPKSNGTTPVGTSKSAVLQMRIARPPIEGRGKNHLLPRYWPRITDQELQQLSGDLNSNIVPLFEKVLSASDAGRIGRLVLPKACAEAYFPAINQSEGIPLRIQDVKGKEWTFQFRFWPNNNSRMYVLEGVTPCIQSMQLQAGDTVTFSRIDPGGKLVMGFRKATNLEDQQGSITPPTGIFAGETSSTGVTENPSSISGLFQMPKERKDPHINGISSADADIRWHKNENSGGRTNEDSSQVKEKKRTRNIGSKSKRLLMHNEDAMELRLTWEEAQDLLRPSPSATPTVFTIEDYEFEEYDEPPVFGKKTLFSSRPTGGQEQWAQCDDCSKWRRLPVDVLLSSRWTCAENIWDASRCSCAAPEELTPKEVENLLKIGRDSKRRRIPDSQKSAPEHEPSGLDALASAAVLGDSLGESRDPSVAATTRHPRHRPGCTCIVCIQPPSGKGKHKSTCTCNVCMTVKRRFKTLMLRKRKRQLEREAEAAKREQNDLHGDSEMDGSALQVSDKNHSDNEGTTQSRIQTDVAETSTTQIDLNSHPYREDMQQLEDPGTSIMSLLKAARLPSDHNYMKQSGFASVITEQQATVSSCTPSQANGKIESHPKDEGLVGYTAAAIEREANKEEKRASSSDNKI